MSNDKMNWATIAPESRLYKGKNLYRWDVSPGLEHHCGVCATPLHNSRAKTTCLGNHVEPCYRFHQQLHFVGKSHECFGCNSSDEMHHNRHKDILKIVRQIATLDQGDPDTPSTIAIGVGAGKRRGSISTPTDTSSESTFTVEAVRMTRRERKKAKKAGNGTPKDKGNVEVFSTDELDFISEAIHLTKYESKGAWAGTYNYGDQKFLGTTSEAEETELEEADVNELGEQSGDFSVKPIALMTPRQRRNLKKYTASIGASNFRFGTRKFNTGLVSGVYDGVDPQIFFRLGVEITNPVQNSRARRELVAKLVAAVKEDLEIIEREEAESTMREQGFWRWAGRNAFNAIMRTREDFDWATGQKIGLVRGGTPIDYGEDDLGVEVPEEPEPEIDKPATILGRKVELLELATPKRKAPAKSMLTVEPPSREIRFSSEKRVPAAIAAWSIPKATKIENTLPDFDDNFGWTEVTSLKGKEKVTQAPTPKSAAWADVKSAKVFESDTKEVKKPFIPVEEVVTQELHDGGDWEVVNKGRGSAKPMSAPKPFSIPENKSVYSLPGDRTTISLK